MTPAPWRRRIVGHADVAPGTLLTHPDNIKIHPQEQMDVMESLLTTIGWAADILVSQRSGRVIDGHLRAMLALKRGEPTIPVTYLDLTDEEEHEALVYLYRTTQMARIDPVNLEYVLKSCATDDPLITAMLHAFAQEHSVALTDMRQPPVPAAPTGREPVLMSFGDIEFTVPYVLYEAWVGALTTDINTHVWVVAYELKRRLGL